MSMGSLPPVVIIIIVSITITMDMIWRWLWTLGEEEGCGHWNGGHCQYGSHCTPADCLRNVSQRCSLKHHHRTEYNLTQITLLLLLPISSVSGLLAQLSTEQVTWLASPRSEAQVLVCLPVRGTSWRVLLQHLLYCDYFSSLHVL